MVDFTNVALENIVVHNVGNSLQQEGIKFSKGPLKLKEEMIITLLKKYFLSPFKGEAFYNFHHDSDLNLNEIFTYASRIFKDPDSFYLQTVNIAKHLYDKSNHHNIKGGEFYLVYFSNCAVGGEYADAIGLFKSENKETYLKVLQQDENFEINHEEGININKLDKGCIIFNIEADKGYKVFIVDNTNKSQEAQYWKNEFLNIKPHEDSYYHTQNYLHLCKDFCNDVLDKQHEVAKADQIDLMNRSVMFFSKKETFNVQEFQEEVMGQPELIDAFKNYKSEYQERNQIQTYDEFDISMGAVKETKRIFKSVIKLDKNFHIYVHGNRDYIERGYDEDKQMHFYQLYFKSEQ